jgi:Guanosine polyphosphate pyrophosphohydrolases/synthetases
LAKLRCHRQSTQQHQTLFEKQQHDESIELGRRLVEKALLELNLSLKDITEADFQNIVELSGLETLNHLFEEVGLGNRSAVLVSKQLSKINHSKYPSNSSESTTPLAIKGTEGILVSYAKCCRPIPGDSIGGYVERGHGLIVHAELCSKLEEYRQNPDKYVALRWEEESQGDFPIDLRAEILNQRGSLAGLALAISDSESNIENINAEEFDGRYFAVNLTVTVHGRAHLARVLRKIRKTKNVIRVIRHKPQLPKKSKPSLLP